MITALTIIHLIIALVLIVTVLLQNGKQQGLSGAISGGAETFFGKNKGKTVDALLKKVTAVVAILFIISSVSLAYLASKPADTVETTQVTETQNVTPTQTTAE
ncbi:MAG: preprotein translocase subunit SecG [Clostridia bacterium]|nr:preprotein translocase subunit SecG [Clostridia bacterium]